MMLARPHLNYTHVPEKCDGVDLLGSNWKERFACQKDGSHSHVEQHPNLTKATGYTGQENTCNADGFLNPSSRDYEKCYKSEPGCLFPS
jgi:hypothetical protein